MASFVTVSRKTLTDEQHARQTVSHFDDFVFFHRQRGFTALETTQHMVRITDQEVRGKEMTRAYNWFLDNQVPIPLSAMTCQRD